MTRRHGWIFIVVAMVIFSLSFSSTVIAGEDVCSKRSNNTFNKLLECVTVVGVRQHQNAFQAIADANDGTREAGTPGYDASIDYVVETLEAAGYEVELNGFDLTFNLPATLQQLAPSPAIYETNAFTGGGVGDLTGQVISVDLALAPPQASTSGCEPTDFDGLDFSGLADIALVQRGACFFSVKAVNAEAAGAEAVIIFNQGNSPTRMGLFAGTASTLPDGSPSNLTIPVVSASFTNGVSLSQVGSTAFINVDPPVQTTQYNVLAELPGKDDGNVVMVGAHLDSVREGPGIQDNGSGSAAILEVALQMAKVKPRNTVRFAWWGGEESDLIGSSAYVNGLTQEEQDDIALYLNFDMIGSPNHVFFIYDGDDSDNVGAPAGPLGSAEIEETFEKFYDMVGEPYMGTDFSGRSDYGPFIAVGIPAGGLFTGAEGIKTTEQAAIWGGTAGEQYDPCYHLACDTYDNVNLTALDVNSDAVAYAVLTYADDKDANLSLEVNLQILAINDFHGNIATSSGSFGGTGRVDYLSTNLQAAADSADNSIFVSAGDLIGASPLISALFHDEPTIEAMNLLGLEINAVGNHEFDEGPAELLRMQYGGSHPVDGDLDGDPFLGAAFEFLAANVVVDDTGETIFPAYTIRNYEGVKVAFIGMTLEGTPTIVTPSGVAGLTFSDEVETVNALVPQLQQQNIEAIVVLLHEGGRSNGGQNDCGTELSGPIAEIVPLLDDAVDLVIAGHTNDEFVCEIDGKWVTMADNRGRLFTDIDVTLDRVTKDMTVVSINNTPNLQAGVTPDPLLTALIDKYDVLSAPLANSVIGTVTTDILRTPNGAGESALGDIVADAQLQATIGTGVGEAVVAFTNPGGIRNDIVFVSSGPEADGEFTFGEAFGVQPFGNSLVTMSLTGLQIDTLLEQQWVGQTSPRILQVSESFTYEWSASAPDGSKVDIASIMINGVAIDPGTSYRITVNSFLADGGDNFTVLVAGNDRLGGEVDLDALVTYFENNSPVDPGPQDRITVIP